MFMQKVYLRLELATLAKLNCKFGTYEVKQQLGLKFPKLKVQVFNGKATLTSH
jgi:hypothetical protein